MIHITDKSQCCGCSACVQRCPKQCIRMEQDAEGFLYPVVDTTLCIDCHLCERVHPIINQDEERNPLNVYAARNVDDNIRLQSSSGGLFTLLAEKTIEQGGVVFGAQWDKEWNVRHAYTDSQEGISTFRGSKYLQSMIGNSYLLAEKFLKEGREVMFTGTPCQIAGLKHFLRKEYANLLAVEVICHSVPSPGVWQQYLSEKLQKLKWDKSDIHHISFRDKKTGWKSYSFTINSKKGSTYTELGGRNLFIRGFLADLYTRPSCYACPSKQLKSGSDITLGDFWGIKSLIPEIDDDKGISAVMVNTEKGNVAMQKISVQLFPVSYEEVVRRNPALVKSAKTSGKKSEFFKEGNGTVEEKVKAITKKDFSFSDIIKRVYLKLFKQIRE